MKISRKSWHYRLNSWARGWRFDQRVSDGQHTTCSYFWTTVGSLLMLSIFSLILLTVAGVALSGLVGLGWMALSGLGVVTSTTPHALMITGVIFSIFLGATGIGRLTDTVATYVADKLDKRDEKRHDLPKEPGFIRQFLKDKKDKVCTIVKVE